MKTKLIFAAAIAAGIVMAPAAANAKSADELRIYINPGHGSWGGGDRNMGTIKHGEPRNEADTCGFFESNTDLWKCLGLVDRLEEYGLKLDRTVNQDNPVRALQGCARDLSQNIFMSRVKNGPVPGSDEDSEAYNRSLYEICCEVQRNNFDMFISVHSNAAGSDMVNYPSFFLRGENGVAGVPGSDTNAAIAWPFAYAQEHQMWTNYSMDRPNVIYDIDFWQGDHVVTTIDGVDYKGYYGVLRHGVMGYMVEGYFHTYSPARHRAMNVDVCHDEGDAYARGIAAIFDIPTEDNGTIYGIVRDRHERFRHKYYNTSARSIDNTKPLNNVKVDLLQNGNVVATYTTDDEWNGAFVFDHLTPGEYYINVTAEGYKAADAAECGPFTVEAAKTLYPNVFLESESYVAPELEAANYPDPVVGGAIRAADSYRMRVAVEAKEIAELAGKTVRRILPRNGNLYVLALDADQKPTLLVLDADLNVAATLGTTVCKGSIRDLADIQFTADGVLIGSSESITHYSDATIDSDFGDTARGSVNFYRWDNDATGKPAGEARVWFTTLASGNLYRGATANTFVYKGTSENGVFFFPTASSYSAQRMFFSYVEVLDGEVQDFTIQNCGLNTDYLCIDNLGHDYTFTLAPFDENAFVVNAPGKPVRAFNIDEITEAGNLPAATMAESMQGANFFKYAGHSYLATAGGAAPALADVTDGLEAPTATEVIVDGTAAEGTALMAAGTGSAILNDEGKTTRADIDLYVLADGRIARYTTAGTEQEAVAGVFAYGLNGTSENGVYTLAFNLSGDAKAHIELNAEGLETVILPSESYSAGANSATVNAADIPDGTYNWSVVVENKAVPAAAPIFTDENTSGNGVAVNTYTDSPAFGTFYYSSKSDRAVFSVTPGFEFSAPYTASQPWDTSVGASPWRLAVLPTGKLLISDWGDKHGGIYLFDPANPTETASNFFAGTIRTSSGEWTYNGTVIGGSTSGMAVAGTGEDTKLYTFQEDYPSDYKLTMACYNIGTTDQIDFAPQTTFPTLSSRMINGNVDVVLADDFMVLSQVRGAGNNTKAVPSFVLASYDDEILFNSSELTLEGSDGAIALTNDATQLLMMDCNDVVRVYDINLNAEVPEEMLTEAYYFTPTAAGEAYQMAFDHAGNLLIAGRNAFQAYTLPREAVLTATPAPAADVVVGTSGVENIEISTDAATDAPAEYYNLQGVRVAAENLTPGFYIERRGNTARKIMVR